MMAKTIYLKDYQAPVFSMDSVSLIFELHEEVTQVHARIAFRRETPGPLVLDGEDLILLDIALDDQTLVSGDYVLSDHQLMIPDVPDAFILTVVTQINPQANTALSGLYRSKELLCTQCEAQGFRRITYFLDRPDAMSIFTCKIIADLKRYPQLLSNGNRIDQGLMDDGRHWVLWHDPFKKPCYLFALVAGPLACVEDEFVTATGKAVAIHLYVAPGQEDKTAHAIHSLKKAMLWDEQEFGLVYDLDLFMMVAVEDFNMGAMENKGLNVFNAQCILARADTATDDDFAQIEGIVAHEYFHNWTGNRVTCRDWFQLSLKEGLTVYRDQEFSSDMNARSLQRILDVQSLRLLQFPEDASAMAHPVQPASYESIDNFYTATVYEKGAELIRMLALLLTKAGFRRGMDLYFSRHDGQAVTIDDFIAAMSDANNMDLNQFKRWYHQVGTPQLTLIRHDEGGLLRLELKQSLSSQDLSKEPLHIPLRFALFSRNGSLLSSSDDCLELREESQFFELGAFTEEPVLSVQRGFSAPIELHCSQTQDELFVLLRFERDAYAKWNAAQRLVLNLWSSWFQTSPDQWLLPHDLVEAFHQVFLDPDIDHALRTEILRPPTFEDALAKLAPADPLRIEAVRDAYRQELSKALLPDAKMRYQEFLLAEDHQFNGPAYARRRCRNFCLEMMITADEDASMGVALEQFKEARTMTSQLGAFAALLRVSRADARASMIESFYTLWSHEPLVLDKWFALQAQSPVVGTLERVQFLLQHSAFNLKNPNKLRALIGGFTQRNPRHFHAVDGSGYVFLKSMLLAIDAFNPQIAARLIKPFTQSRSLDALRQQKIQACLEELAASALSPNVQEWVHKSLSHD